jgi:hypothetical protein
MASGAALLGQNSNYFCYMNQPHATCCRFEPSKSGLNKLGTSLAIWGACRCLRAPQRSKRRQPPNFFLRGFTCGWIMVQSDHMQSIRVVNGYEAVWKNDNGDLTMPGSHRPCEHRTWRTSRHLTGIFHCNFACDRIVIGSDHMQTVVVSQTGEKPHGKMNTGAIWSWPIDFVLWCAQPFVTWSRLSKSTFLRDVTLSYLTHWIKTHHDNFPCFVQSPQPSGSLG